MSKNKEKSSRVGSFFNFLFGTNQNKNPQNDLENITIDPDEAQMPLPSMSSNEGMKRSSSIESAAENAPAIAAAARRDSQHSSNSHKNVSQINSQTLARTGMVLEHAKAQADFCQSTGTTIIYRGVNPAAAKKLAENYIGKVMTTKAKSSEFLPFAAEIPLQAGLNKKANNVLATNGVAGEDYNRSLIELAGFQNDNDTGQEKSTKRYEEIMSKEGISEEQRVEELNAASIHTTVNKVVEIEGEEYELIHFSRNKNINGTEYSETLYDYKNKTPIFAVEIDGQLQSISFDEIDGKMITNFTNPPSNLNDWEAQKVEIIAYQPYSLINGKIMPDEARPVAPDYDGLTSSTQNILPFLNRKMTTSEDGLMLANQGDFVGEFTIVISDLESLKAAKIPAEYCRDENFSIQVKFDPDKIGEVDNIFSTTTSCVVNGETVTDLNLQEEIIKKSILADKISKEAQECSLQSISEAMGRTTADKAMAKNYLQGYLGGATSHADENSNPNPEPLIKDNYATFTPDGEIRILENPEEICEFINAERRNGTPLQVNPLWCWLPDNEGSLFIPEESFDFDKFKNARSNINGNEIENQIHDNFMEYLHFQTCAGMGFSPDKDGIDLPGLQDELRDNFENYRQEKLVELEHEINLLNENSPETSKMASVFFEYQNWQETQQLERQNKKNLSQNSACFNEGLIVEAEKNMDGNEANIETPCPDLAWFHSDSVVQVMAEKQMPDPEAILEDFPVNDLPDSNNNKEVNTR